MARKLFTEFVKVATSGPTIDGREIPAKDITEMAETYDLEEYTANITYEHIRYFGNLGKVEEVKAETDKKGRMCLFARLAPSDELIYLNNNGQKLFTSIEIQPNFGDSGKAYLKGLAVTDSPASLGTTELQFRSRAQNPDNYFTSPSAMSSLELEGNDGVFSKFRQKFSKPDDNEQDTSAMNEEQFKQLLEAFNAQTQVSQDLLAKFTSLEEKLNENSTVETPESDDDKEVGVTQESFNQLKSDLKEMSDKYSALVDEEVPGTEHDDGSGDAERSEVI